MTHPALGINTYAYIWSTPLVDCVRRFRALGYTDFEPVINPPHLAFEDADAATRRRLRRSLEADGIRLRSLNLPSLDVNLASPMPQTRAYSVGIFRAAIELAAELGIPRLITVPGRVNPLLAPAMVARERWMRESLEALLPMAESCGVGLALENVPFASFPDADSLGSFVRGMRCAALSVCYDVANAQFIGESPAWGLVHLRDLVSVVHFSDTGRARWRHDEIGAGDVPFSDVRTALEAIDFGGPCMLEIIDPDPEPAILRSHRVLAGLGFGSCPTGLPA